MPSRLSATELIDLVMLAAPVSGGTRMQEGHRGEQKVVT
jgi:acetyl-CoA carboxylase beta subunit